MTITIYGWPSFEAWRDAGMPSAVSFANPKTDRKPDPRRGLCSYPGCDKVLGGSYYNARLELCGTHYDLVRSDHAPTVRVWPELSDAVRIAREKARD